MDEIVAFAAEHVAALTGLTPRQLRYWDNTGFFSPALGDEGAKRGASYARVYSFRDVVGLRAIAMLRDRVPLQELRKVGEWLRKEYDTPWSSLRFAVLGRKVVFFDPVTCTPAEPWGAGQTLLEVPLEPIANEVSEAAKMLKRRKPEQFGKVARNRYVAHNAWVIAGTRVPTEAIWRFHEEGYDTDAILSEYPTLTKDDVLAAIESEAKRREVA